MAGTSHNAQVPAIAMSVCVTSFLKKSTKDNKKNIAIAEQIITKYTSEDEET